MGKQETKPDKKPMRMVTSKMSIEETIEVLREDLKTNVRSKAWRKHILLNPKVEGMARFPSGVDSVLIMILLTRISGRARITCGTSCFLQDI